MFPKLQLVTVRPIWSVSLLALQYIPETYHLPEDHNVSHVPIFHGLRCAESDTSSAYSGSDTMASAQSSGDTDEVDLTGLVEGNVDSDEEEDLVESMEVL